MKSRILLPSAKTTLTIIVIVVYTATLTSLFAALLDSYSNVRMPSFGTIYALGYDIRDGDIIRVDGNKTLDWGAIYVGSSTNRSFFLKSKSNTVTKPQLNYGNWTFKNTQNEQRPSPPLDNVIVNWNINDTSLEPNQEVYVTLTLAFQHNETFIDDLIRYNIRTFSFDIAIYPSQV